LHFLDRILGRIPRWQTAGLCLGLIAIIAVADHYTGVERLLALLYLLPVSLGAWYLGKSQGLALAVLSVATALLAGWPHVPAADLVGEAGFFVTVAVLVGRLQEQQAADRASQRLIHGIINAIPGGVFWKDKNLVYLGCNAEFARGAGFEDPKDLIGKDDYQMLWRDQADLYRADDRQVIESECAKLLIEEPSNTPDGTITTLLTSKIPLRGSKGEVIGVLGTYMDIAERIKTEELLRASEVRYRRLFESAKDGILILDGETGMVVDVNPSLVEWLGLSREAFLGKRIWELAFLSGIAANQARFVELQEKGYLRDEDAALETRDARRVAVEFVSNAYLVNREKVIQCVFRDVTRERQVEQMRDDLTHTMVHDLRSPLTTIRATLEMVGMAATLKPELREMIDIARSNAQRQLSLIDSILSLNQLEQGAVPLEPSWFALSELAMEVLRLAAPRSASERIALVNEVASDLPEAWADRNLLGRVLDNLVGNAIKFTPPGGVVRVGAERVDAEALRIYVRDTGYGVPEELRPRLFLKFATGAQKGRGSGLGLAFCRLVVEAHGGKIWLENDPGAGASLVFTLPHRARSADAVVVQA
jgi:PAS domain S-box-containing protein